VSRRQIRIDLFAGDCEGHAVAEGVRKEEHRDIASKSVMTLGFRVPILFDTLPPHCINLRRWPGSGRGSSLIYCGEDGTSTRCEFVGGPGSETGSRSRRESERVGERERKGRSEAAGTRAKRG